VWNILVKNNILQIFIYWQIDSISLCLCSANIDFMLSNVEVIAKVIVKSIIKSQLSHALLLNKFPP
jgi:hypothetical protein